MATAPEVLASLTGQAAAVVISPAHPDFTDPKGVCHVRVMGAVAECTFSVRADSPDLGATVSILDHYLGKAVALLCWNLKGYHAFVLGCTGRAAELGAGSPDLQVLEHYLGLAAPPPGSLVSAKGRALAVTKHPSWPVLKKVYSQVYSPLITRTIPNMECHGFAHDVRRVTLHPCYDVASHVNGRLSCSQSYRRGMNAHAVPADDRPHLRIPRFDQTLLYLDYHYMEAAVLQWLSGDPVLGDLIASGEDLYDGVWRILTGAASTPACREKCKDFFLPVAYGQGAESVSARLRVPVDLAKRLIDRLHDKFRTAMSWIGGRAVSVDGWAADALGRRRRFDGQEYRVRGFSVQSPAALFCLEKLVRLGDAFRVAAHVHDGYLLAVPKVGARRVEADAVAVLEGESDLFPGLRLRVRRKSGETLGDVW